MQACEEAYEEVKVPGFISPANELNDNYEQHQNDISDFDRIKTMSDTAFEDQQMLRMGSQITDHVQQDEAKEMLITELTILNNITDDQEQDIIETKNQN